MEKNKSKFYIGKIIAITVEEEEDIAKFKDYSPSASNARKAGGSRKWLKSQLVSPDPKISKPIAASSEDCIFVGPLARKLAEDNKGTIKEVVIVSTIIGPVWECFF